MVVTKPARCQCCHTACGDEDHTLDARYDKIDLPQVRPVVTRVERYSGTCRGCGAVTLAAVPEGLEPGTPFSLMELAIYLRITHAISDKRLSRLFMDLFGLAISQGALDAAFRRCKPRVDAERELRPTAAYRKVTGGFRSEWGADFYAGIRSVIGTAKRHGIDAYRAVTATLRSQTLRQPG